MQLKAASLKSFLFIAKFQGIFAVWQKIFCTLVIIDSKFEVHYSVVVL
jgi:hypothetical protein